MQIKDAVDWHTKIASEFDEKYSNSKYFKERFIIWKRFIDKYSNHNYSVLDLGCGSGTFTFYLAEINRAVIGLDASAEMLKLCHNKYQKSGLKNVKFINSYINNIEVVLNQKFDIVFCSSVLEYVDDLDETIRLISRSMKLNGLLLFSLPNKNSFLRRIEPITYKYFRRPRYYEFVKNISTPSEIEKTLNKYNFSIIENKYYGKTPLLSKLFSIDKLSCYSNNLFVSVARLTN